MTKVRRVLHWLMKGNALMSPDMARVMGLSPGERTSIIKYLRVKRYVEATGPCEYRVTELGAAAATRVHKTDARTLARQRKGYRKKVQARQAVDQIVSHARWNVPNSVFSLGAMNA